MAAVPDPAGADVSRADAQGYAADWARAVRRLGFVPLSLAETERLLLLHTVRLAQALLAEPFSARPAEEVGPGAGRGAPDRAAGAGLVGARARRGASRVRVLPADGRPADLAERIAAVQGALAAGFARALRDRTFSQQERIARSAWQARDEVEQALRDSEARFRAVFTGAAIGIGIAGIDGQIIDVNQAFADMLGYTIEELRHDQRGVAVPRRRRRRHVGALPEADRGQAGLRPGGEALPPQGRQRGLDRPGRLADPARRRPAPVHRRDDRGHHRAVRAPAAAALPGAARPADRPAQPDALLRDPGPGLRHRRRRGSGSGSASSTWTASRRSTTASATTWATGCWS